MQSGASDDQECALSAKASASNKLQTEAKRLRTFYTLAFMLAQDCHSRKELLDIFRRKA
jgi:hypothetical protein